MAIIEGARSRAATAAGVAKLDAVAAAIPTPAITDAAVAAAAPTKAEFDALVGKFNALLAQLRTAGIVEP